MISRNHRSSRRLRLRQSCRRSELAAAQIGTNSYGYAYDTIGNRIWSSANTSTTSYTANCLNQYSSISTLCASASPCELSLFHDADGNMTDCGPWSYTYDSASQLVTMSSNGVLLVTNRYDCRRRRVKKITPTSTHTFLYDDWNLIHERVDYMNGSTDEFNYFWGRDLSGSLQVAGGVGGLLYLKRNGSVYIPLADANGNIMAYADSMGTVVAEYVYDAFGRTISQSGTLADVFRHRFSTKYFDVETGLYYYGYRFYSPEMMRWLTRDPEEENGGTNLYVFCRNAALDIIDNFGLAPSIRWEITYSRTGLFREALEDFLNGGEAKVYHYAYPDSASTRLLSHEAVAPVWQEYNSISKSVSGDYTIRKSIRYTARFRYCRRVGDGIPCLRSAA